jgi:hypothetical protein
MGVSAYGRVGVWAYSAYRRVEYSNTPIPPPLHHSTTPPLHPFLPRHGLMTTVEFTLHCGSRRRSNNRKAGLACHSF